MRTEGYNEPGTLNAYAIEPGEVQPEDRYGYKVVCYVHKVTKNGRPMFWSVYRLWTTASDAKTASNGDVIPYEAAKILFPSIDAAFKNGRAAC